MSKLVIADGTEGEGMVGLSREERLQIMLSPEEIKALDDWRFAQRMPSRASAVRELLKRGLAAEGVVIPPHNGRTRSQDYGVVPDGGDSE